MVPRTLKFGQFYIARLRFVGNFVENCFVELFVTPRKKNPCIFHKED